uniref:Ig-like domain-containing protein n=1 Tax=Knipowitschia caucasica TaxID=637954 RepID=A0AAV2K3K4_KNICA
MATLRFYVCFMLTFTLVAGQSPYYVLKAREAILTPALTKSPDNILWKHNGEKVITFDSAEERVFAPYHDRVLLAWDTAQLTITDVRYEDSGEYELDANVKGRLYRSQYMLKVLDKVSKPVITCEMSDDESSSNSTAVRATLSCSSESMTPEALKFKWNLKGKSHLGPVLPIALGNDLDDITYSCTANNPLHAETSVFTAKDCYTEKSSQVLDILVPIIIASLILLAFCLFPFIFRHQIKRACFMNGKNNDLEKQLQATAADSAQNNEERAPFLETDLHRQETIPSQQRLPKQSSVRERGEGGQGKVKELRKVFEHPDTDTGQTNVGPASPSSSVPKTSVGLMASGEKSALNSEDHQNTDTDPNHSDPEEDQDSEEEAEPTHTDQVQQNMEPTGGPLNSDQAESEADEHRENQKKVEPDKPTRTRDQQEFLQSTAASVLPVKSGSKEQTDANEETNTDMVEVDPQKDLSKKETMVLKEKEPEMSQAYPAQSSSPPDQGLAAPEVTQRPDGGEDSDTEERAPQKEPEESKSAEEEPGLAKKAEKPDALSPQAPVQSSSSQDQDSKPEDREKVEEEALLQMAPAESSSSQDQDSKPEDKEKVDCAEDSNSDSIGNPHADQNVTPDHKETESNDKSELSNKVNSPADNTSSAPPFDGRPPPESDKDQPLTSEPSSVKDKSHKERDADTVEPQIQDSPSKESEESKLTREKVPAATSSIPVKSGSKEQTDSNEETNTDMVEVDPQKDLSKKETMVLKEKEPEMSQAYPAQSSSPPDQGLAAPEVTQRPDGGEDSDTEERAPQKEPEESKSAEEEPGLAKKAEKPESDKDQPLTSEPSSVKDKSHKERDANTVDPQIQDSPSKESEESKLTREKVPAATSSIPGSETQEPTHPPDSTLSPPTDENEEPKDAAAEPKDEADKAPHVKLDTDKL